MYKLFSLPLLLGGSTWSQTSAPNSSYWKDIASDSTGSRLAAVGYDYVKFTGGIYISTSG